MYSNKEALLRNYNWYVTNLNYFNNSSGIDHRKPWKQGVLIIAKKFF